MAKLKIYRHAENILSMLWWKFMPGTEIEVRWPFGWVILDDDGAGNQTSAESADPNDHYRPYLEKHVGKQCIDWN
jgi:hypothetical protein